MNTNVVLNLIRVRELKILGKARVKLKLIVRRKCVCVGVVCGQEWK